MAKGCEIRSTVRMCCVCVLCLCVVCCVCVLCLCVVCVVCCVCVFVCCVFVCCVFVFVSRTFVYICVCWSLISFIYVPLTCRPQPLRSRARSCTFQIFFEWLSKGSLQKYMNDPCFSFGCVVRLPLFFFSVVRYLRGGGYLQARPWSPGLHPRWHQMPIFSLCLSCTNWILLAWILHTATHMYPQICAAQSLKRLLPPLVHSSELGGL